MAAYLKKIQLTFNDTEQDLIDYIDSLGSKSATVVKNIIREKMFENQREKNKGLEEKLDKLLNLLSDSEQLTLNNLSREKVVNKTTEDLEIEKINKRIGDEDEEFKF